MRHDLGRAAFAWVQSGRGREALPIFERLGDDAGGLPWSYWPDPAKTLGRFCNRAAKAK